MNENPTLSRDWRTMFAHDPLFAHDPFAPFYNLDGFTTFALTTDIDWAPDYCVEDVFRLIEDAGLRLTAFATHDSHVARTAPKFVEIGLHPDNTRPHPEHGLSRKIPDLLDIYPQAVGLRAHRNFFGQNIAQMAAAAGLQYDASVLHWRQPFCQAGIDQYGLVRMCYNWEDGIHADRGLPWDLAHVPIAGPGLKIFNMHPIFIYLNCPDDGYRRRVVKDYKDLTTIPRNVVDPLVHDGYGARRFLIDLLQHLKATGARSIVLSEIAAAKSAS